MCYFCIAPSECVCHESYTDSVMLFAFAAMGYFVASYCVCVTGAFVLHGELLSTQICADKKATQIATRIETIEAKAITGKKHNTVTSIVATEYCT